MTNNNSTNQGIRKNKKRNPEVAIVEKGDASDGTLYDAEAAIHLTAAFA